MLQSNENQSDLQNDLSSGPTVRLKAPDGTLRPLSVDNLHTLLAPMGVGIEQLDLRRFADRVFAGLYDGVSEAELDRVLVQVSSGLIAEEPDWAQLAARLLNRVLVKEVRAQGVRAFSDSIRLGHREGLISDVTAAFVNEHAAVLDAAIDDRRAELFVYFGLRTVYDRYLLRHPITRKVTETSQIFFMRVACGLSRTPEEAIELYRLISSLEYLPSSPTLFNAGTRHSQMSSCYLLESPTDDLEGIYQRYTDIAKLCLLYTSPSPRD